MRQRVMIALALAGRPDLLLADEATTALDVTIERGILSLLRDRQLTDGMALLLITHDLSIVGALADSVVIMYAGTTVEAGNADAVFAEPSASLHARASRRAARIARQGQASAGDRRRARPGSARRSRAALSRPAARSSCPSAGPRRRRLEIVAPDHSVACFRVAGVDRVTHCWRRAASRFVTQGRSGTR